MATSRCEPRPRPRLCAKTPEVGNGRRSAASWSRTAARSRSGSSAPAASWASRRSRSTATPTPTPPTSGRPTRPSASGRRRRPRATCGSTRSSTPPRATGAEAIHPGYGFLAERAAFAEAVEDAGLVFVGPSRATIAALGDKLAARRAAQSAGRAGRARDARARAGRPAGRRRRDRRRRPSAIGFPLLVKAAAGGGGRGMRRVDRARDLAGGARRRVGGGASAFGDGAVYLEREIRPARHVEVQLLGDADGRVVALGERDCSLQRRHQKLVEEAPAPGLTTDQRRELHDAGRPRRRRPAGLAQRRDGRVPARPGRRGSGSSRSTPGSRSSTA